LRRGVELDVRDISRDPQALDDLTQKYDGYGTPTIVIGDRVIVGFDVSRIDAALAAMSTSE